MNTFRSWRAWLFSGLQSALAALALELAFLYYCTMLFKEHGLMQNFSSVDSDCWSFRTLNPSLHRSDIGTLSRTKNSSWSASWPLEEDCTSKTISRSTRPTYSTTQLSWATYSRLSLTFSHQLLSFLWMPWNARVGVLGLSARWCPVSALVVSRIPGNKNGASIYYNTCTSLFPSTSDRARAGLRWNPDLHREDDIGTRSNSVVDWTLILRYIALFRSASPFIHITKTVPY